MFLLEYKPSKFILKLFSLTVTHERAEGTENPDGGDEMIRLKHNEILIFENA